MRLLLSRIVENVLVELAVAEDLDRRDDRAFLVDHLRVGRQRARHLAADVGHMAEHRRPGDQPAVEEDRHHQQPVVEMADRAGAGIGIVGEEDVAVLDRPVIAGDEAVQERAELADHHLAFLIGDQRKGVVLLADAGAHGGAEQHRVHFDARVAQRVLDDVERDRIDGHALERRRLGLDRSCWHGLPLRGSRRRHSSGRPSDLPCRSARSGCCRTRRRSRRGRAGSASSRPSRRRSPGPAMRLPASSLPRVVDRRLAPAVADIDAAALRRRRATDPARRAARRAADERLLRAQHDRAQADQFMARVEREGEQLLVHPVEALGDAGEALGAEVGRRNVDRQLHALAGVAHVDLIERLLAVAIDAVGGERLRAPRLRGRPAWRRSARPTASRNAARACARLRRAAASSRRHRRRARPGPAE